MQRYMTYGNEANEIRFVPISTMTLGVVPPRLQL